MQEQLEQRVKELKAEFEAGQQQLQNLEERAAALKETLLRISGAIQVLEEEIERSGQTAQSQITGDESEDQ